METAIQLDVLRRCEQDSGWMPGTDKIIAIQLDVLRRCEHLDLELKRARAIAAIQLDVLRRCEQQFWFDLRSMGTRLQSN